MATMMRSIPFLAMGAAIALTFSAPVYAQQAQGGVGAGLGVSVGGANGVNAGVGAGIGNGVGAGLGASAGGGGGVNAGLGASIGGSGGVDAGATASVGNGVGADVGVSIGGGSATSPTGTGITSPSASTSNPSRQGRVATISNMSPGKLAKMRKRCAAVIADLDGYDADLVSLCRMLRGS
ncbi:MAG: hypothetical protein QM744_09270 [Mesorhizobium sp.]